MRSNPDYLLKSSLLYKPWHIVNIDSILRNSSNRFFLFKLLIRRLYNAWKQIVSLVNATMMIIRMSWVIIFIRFDLNIVQVCIDFFYIIQICLGSKRDKKLSCSTFTICLQYGKVVWCYSKLWKTDWKVDMKEINIAFFNPAVTYAAAQHQGRLFWITFKRLKLLRKVGRLQLIQNSAPIVAGWHQCCIRINTYTSSYNNPRIG